MEREGEIGLFLTKHLTVTHRASTVTVAIPLCRILLDLLVGDAETPRSTLAERIGSTCFALYDQDIDKPDPSVM
jgi:hypothetical protein